MCFPKVKEKDRPALKELGYERKKNATVHEREGGVALLLY